jgi:hypothetical protein
VGWGADVNLSRAHARVKESDRGLVSLMSAEGKDERVAPVGLVSEAH